MIFTHSCSSDLLIVLINNLIQKYTRLFVEASNIGGSPQEIGRFVSDNVEKILELRRDKAQIVDSLRGSLMPMIFIVTAILVFMQFTLDFLGSILSASSLTGGPSLTGIGSSPEPLFIALYFGGLIFTLPIFGALAITFPQQTHITAVSKFLYKVYIFLGIELYVVSAFSSGFLGTFASSV